MATDSKSLFSDVPMMKPDGLRSVAQMATREQAHAYRDERCLRSSRRARCPGTQLLLIHQGGRTCPRS
jgi:hypothetical protein